MKKSYMKSSGLCLLGLLLAVLCASCEDPVNPVNPVIPADRLGTDKEITAFTFTAEANSELSEDVEAIINDVDITAIMPAGTSFSALIATFETRGDSVYVAEVEQTSGQTANDFSSGLRYTVTAEDGSTKDYCVTLSHGLHRMSGLSPATNSATASLVPELSWDAIDGASGYQVQIAATESDLADASVETTAGSSLTPGNYPPGFIWYWRVRAMDEDEPLSEWSSVAALSVNWSNRPLLATGPASGSTITDTTPELTWGAVNGAEGYEIQLSTTNSGVSGAIPIEAGEPSYLFTVPQDNNSEYYWRVRAVSTDAVDDTAIYSGYSAVGTYELNWGNIGPADGIRFAQELAQLSETAFLDGTYEVTADIDLSGYAEWTPIGDSNNPFTGSFDGGGYTISGLSTTTATNYQGLFGEIEDASIENIHLSGVSLVGTIYVGALVGQANFASHITSCSAQGSVAGSSYVGGLVGRISGTYTEAGTVQDCQADIGVTFTGSNAGGLIGGISATAGDEVFAVSGSSASGDVLAGGSSASTAGGLIGQVTFKDTSQISVTHSSATGSVSVNGGGGVGGLIGVFWYTSSTTTLSIQSYIADCYATGSVTATGNTNGIGGLIGVARGLGDGRATVERCYATGAVEATVTSSSCAGGLVGYLYTNSTVDDCYATGSVTSQGSVVGGLVGHNRNGTIRTSYALGAVSGTSSLGGISGSGSGTVEDCFYNIDTCGVGFCRREHQRQ